MRSAFKTETDVLLKLLGINFDKYANIVGAEIGVYKGKTSGRLLGCFPNLKLYMIDPWQVYSDYEDHTQYMTQEKLDEAYISASGVKNKFCPRGIIIRKFSEEAVRDITVELDWVFIDGNHSEEYVLKDLQLWVPKVKTGGIVSGHDYGRRRYPGVTRAVDAFFAQVNLEDKAIWWIKKQ